MVILAYSCKTAHKSYQKGNYEDAIERGVKKLQKDPYDYETKDLVQQSYNFAVDQRQDEIRILSNSKDDSRYERIFQQYSELQRLYDAIHEYPAVAKMIKTTDYSDYVRTYRDKAADIHIGRAAQWEKEGTKKAWREAYQEYAVAMNYRPEDYDLRRKKDSAYYSAVTRVVISPIQNYGGYQHNSASELQEFQRNVIRTLSNNMNNAFVEFYSENEARMRNLNPDHILELNLSRISIGQRNDEKSSREVSKEVVVKEIVYKPDSVVKQYATVTAKVITVKRVLVSQGDLLLRLRDAKGLSVFDDRFTGEHRWQTEMVSYTGDERALSDADKKLLNQREANPPTEDQIMEELLRRIQNDLSSRLRSYYTRLQ